MIQEIKESDYTIAALIYTGIHLACLYGAVCIGTYIGCIIFNTQYDFIATVITWLVFNTIWYGRDTYYKTKNELKEHVKDNGGII